MPGGESCASVVGDFCFLLKKGSVPNLAFLAPWRFVVCSSVLEIEYAARELAALQIRQRARELVECVMLRDQLVDLEASGEVQIGEHGKIASRAGGAVATPQDRLVLVERLHHEIEARAELR